jgi:hypothetical protein
MLKNGETRVQGMARSFAPNRLTPMRFVLTFGVRDGILRNL